MRDDEMRLAESATPAEQFSLWAMRLWSGGFPELDQVWPELIAGFKHCAARDAIEPFHRFCSIAIATAGCSAGVACVHCPAITPIEEKLLDVLAIAASGDADRTGAVLREVIPATAARIAAPHAIRFAKHLSAAGLQWPRSAAATVRRPSFNWNSVPEVSQRLH